MHGYDTDNHNRKIENFIRTKYDSKRWVMDGGMPDPATLDVEGDDDVVCQCTPIRSFLGLIIRQPLNVIQEKAKLDQSSSLRTSSAPTQPPVPRRQAAQEIDLFGDSLEVGKTPISARPSSAAPPSQPQRSDPKPGRAGDSLLGFDFYGMTQPPRPSSAASASAGLGGPSRPDLKQSILSLYASAPKTVQPQQAPAPAAAVQGNHMPSGNELDAFEGLSMSSDANSPLPPPQKPTAFSPLASSTSLRPNVAPVRAANVTNTFFDTQPIPTTVQVVKASSAPAPTPKTSGLRSSSGLGDFGDFSSGPSQATISKPAIDLFDFSGTDEPVAGKAIAASRATTVNPSINSAFDLSGPRGMVEGRRTTEVSSKGMKTINSLGNEEGWGGDNAWASSSEGGRETSKASKASPTVATSGVMVGSWGAEWGGESREVKGVAGVAGPATIAAAEPRVTADEDFGGWESSTVPSNDPASSTKSAAKGSTGFGGSEDLFSNVWE